MSADKRDAFVRMLGLAKHALQSRYFGLWSKLWIRGELDPPPPLVGASSDEEESAAEDEAELPTVWL